MPLIPPDAKKSDTHRIHLAVSTNRSESGILAHGFGTRHVNPPSTVRQDGNHKALVFNRQRGQRHE